MWITVNFASFEVKADYLDLMMALRLGSKRTVVDMVGHLVKAVKWVEMTVT